MMDKWLDRYRITRRITLALALWMTWEAFQFGVWFATGNARNGMEIAAIITAVSAPVAAFAGWVFRVYATTKEI